MKPAALYAVNAKGACLWRRGHERYR